MSLPIQKLATKDKTATWFKECALEALSLAVRESNSIAMSKEEKQINLNLYDGIIDKTELKKQFDTLKLFTKDYTPSFKNFAVVKDKIDVLYGEFIERNEEYGVAVTDYNSLSKKMEERRVLATNLLRDYLSKDNNLSEDEVRDRLAELKKDKFISTYEKATNKLLEIVKKTSGVGFLKSEGFREALTVADAIFYVGIRNDNVYVRKCDTLNTYVARLGNSNNVKDAEIIAEVRYLPLGKIFDEYGEYVDTDKMFKSILKNGGTSGGISSGTTEAQIAMWHQIYDGDKTHGFFKEGMNQGLELTDSKGNIRVADVTWKGYRKIFKRKYYEKGTGETLYDYKSEYYVADEDAGEVLTPRFVTEWYRTTIIGGDNVVNHGVKEPRIPVSNNPFDSSSGYVGGYFNIGNNRAKSMVSMIAPFVYLINILHARAEDIVSKNMGKIIEMDLANIPDGWTVNKVLTYMKIHGIRVKDSFKQGNKGIAQGKLAGHMNTSSTPLDMEIGSSLQQILGMIANVESQISKITGITPQRLGSISSRELVGNVERSQVQSSNMTEYWFNRYEKIILDLNHVMFNTAKQLVKQGVMFQAILDDHSYAIFDFEDDGFTDATIELFPVNSKKYRKLTNLLEQTLAQGLPNGQVSYAEIINIFKANNSFDMIAQVQKMEAVKERKAKQAEEQKQKSLLEQQKQALQAEAEKQQKEMDFELMLKEIEQRGKIELKLIDLDMKNYYEGVVDNRDTNSNGVKDNIELEKAKIQSDGDKDKLRLEYEKLKVDRELRLKDIEVKLKAIKNKNIENSK